MFQKSINSQQARVGLNPNLWHRLKYLIQIQGRTPPSLLIEIQQLWIFEIHPVKVIKSQLSWLKRSYVDEPKSGNVKALHL